MTEIRTLAIPVYNRGDLLERCIESVDEPFETLVIINNGQDQKVADVAVRAQAYRYSSCSLFGSIVIETFKNLGCGPSWNHVMRTYPGPWLFSGNDAQFKPGSLLKLKDALRAAPDADIVCGAGYSVFAMTPSGLGRIGEFDENFYPAYFEDCDHFRRVSLCGAKAVGVPGFEYVHGEAPHWGSSTINSNPEINKKNGVAFGNLRDYYVRKWGGTPGQEKWKTPFNKDVPLSWWELDPALRKKNSLW